MPSTPDTLIRDIRMEFDDLLDFVTGQQARSAQVYTIERGLLGRLLGLGGQLLALFFAVRARDSRSTSVVTPQGRRLPYHCDKHRSYLSIFGLIRFARPYFYARGLGGSAPFDAVLGLPSDRYSDLLREMTESLAVEVPYGKTAAFFERFFGLGLSSRVLAEVIEADALDVEAFYQAKPAPPSEQEAEVLVLQADGKGVPLVRNAQGDLCKKEALVTGLYTSKRRLRGAEEVIASFYTKHEKTGASVPDSAVEKAPSSAQVRPQHKQLWATLKGKDTALDRLKGHVESREGHHITARVALCDGCQALQERIEARFPAFELVLDFVHVSGYLWKAAEVLFDEASDRQAWVKTQALALLRGETLAVIDHVERRGQERRSWQRERLRGIAGYFRRNAERMDYGRYLAQGWPIASGVIEGACRHLVKDRCEGTGMRWTQAGAESLLGLRSVYVNGDWEAYHGFHRQKQYRRRYGQAAPVYELVEDQALKWAA
jgi:hypothetical protein